MRPYHQEDKFITNCLRRYKHTFIGIGSDMLAFFVYIRKPLGLRSRPIFVCSGIFLCSFLCFVRPSCSSYIAVLCCATYRDIPGRGRKVIRKCNGMDLVI